MIDARYIAETHSDWKVSLDKWAGHFSQEDQENIRDSTIFIELHLSKRNKVVSPKKKPK